MTDYLQKQIAARHTQLTELDKAAAKIAHNRAVIEAELRAYEDALAHLPATAAPSKVTTGKRRGGRRGLSRHWKAVFADMAKTHPRTSGYDNIEHILKEHGKEVRRANLRRHMLSYLETGYVERVRNGHFRITDKGRKAADLLKEGANDVPPQNETPDVSASSVSGNGNGGSAPFLVERQEPRLLT